MGLCSTRHTGLSGLVPFSPERVPASGSGLPSSCPPHSFFFSLRVGPLAALVAAHSATVPVRASFLTARASTVSALRSSSDEDPKSLPFGERPAPRAHMPPSLRGLRTPFSRPLEPQVASPAYWPGNQLWREVGSWQSSTQRALGQLD